MQLNASKKKKLKKETYRASLVNLFLSFQSLFASSAKFIHLIFFCFQNLICVICVSSFIHFFSYETEYVYIFRFTYPKMTEHMNFSVFSSRKIFTLFRTLKKILFFFQLPFFTPIIFISLPPKFIYIYLYIFLLSRKSCDTKNALWTEVSLFNTK
jgi:hypothetical protein